MKQKRATVLTTALIAIALFAFGSISRAQGPPPPPPPPPPGAYDAPPDGFSDAMRHAFIDGAQAARADYRAGLRPDPRRTDLFRHPPVPPPGRNDYRSAFGKGYEVATRHLTSRDSGGNDRGYDRGAPPPPPPPPGAMPPPPPPGTVPPPPPAPYEL